MGLTCIFIGYFYSQKPSDWINFWLSSDFIIRLYCWSCDSVSELIWNILDSAAGLWSVYLGAGRLPSSSLNWGERSASSSLSSVASLGVFWTFSATCMVFPGLFWDSSLHRLGGIAGVELLNEPLRRLTRDGVHDVISSPIQLNTFEIFYQWIF